MRVVNRLAAVLLALILVAIGLFFIVQTVSGLVGHPWPATTAVRDNLAATPFADRRVLWVSIVVALVGLLIVVAQLIPRPQRRLPTELRPDWYVRRRSAERRGEEAAENVQGVDHAHLGITGDRTRWRVRVTGTGPEDHRPLEESVRTELAALAAPELNLSIALRRRRVE